jgi:hypothetical protein
VGARVWSVATLGPRRVRPRWRAFLRPPSWRRHGARSRSLSCGNQALLASSPSARPAGGRQARDGKSSASASAPRAPRPARTARPWWVRWAAGTRTTGSSRAWPKPARCRGACCFRRLLAPGLGSELEAGTGGTLADLFRDQGKEQVLAQRRRCESRHSTRASRDGQLVAMACTTGC